VNAFCLVMFSDRVKDSVEEKASGLAMYVRRESAIIQYCATVSGSGSVSDVVL